MAYASKDMSVLAYANGFTLWHYATADVVATVEGAGYFNLATDMVRPGDIVLTNSSTGSTPVANIHTVATNAAGVVGLAKVA
ncbi:conserved hypothetical protein [uncultured Gammaproteobacteria bacterium]